MYVRSSFRAVRPLIVVSVVGALAFGCGDDPKPNPFAAVPDCTGPTITQGAGDRQLVISSLQLAPQGEGLDLNGDGTVDNKLALIGALVNQSLTENFRTDHDVVLPFELYGYTGADSACTKLQLYKANFNKDRDGDMVTTTWNHGDCMDTMASVNPKATEDLTNRIDDDCDGYADNATKGSKPTDNQDLDGDGYTLAMGDCDDRNDAANIDLAKSRHPGATEICDDGIDQDCDGIADNGSLCDPNGNNKPPLTLDTSITPIPIGFGAVKAGVLEAGPGLFNVKLPPIQGAQIDLSLIGVRFKFPLTDGANGTSVKGGLLAGVIPVQTLAKTKGLSADTIISPEQSLLDAIFVGQIGLVLGLDRDKDQHTLPDMDVDGDGLETFWQEGANTTGIPLIDTCKDGNGEIIKNNFDGKGTPCYLATDATGKPRFVDGISVAINIDAVPAKIAP
jgi:hypothetical protein